MRCEQVKEWMNDRLDGCLDDGHSRELDAHLAGCEACRREWEELRQAVTLIRSLPAVVPPSDLPDAVRARVERKRETPLLMFWRVISLPQTRVAVAAGLVIVVGLYGLRMMETPPVVRPERMHDAVVVKSVPVGSAPAPVVVDKADIVVEKRLEVTRTARPVVGRAQERDGIWAESDARNEAQNEPQPASGLSVGYDRSAGKGKGQMAPEVLSVPKKEAVGEGSEGRRRENATKRLVEAADKAEAPRPAEEKEERMVAQALAPVVTAPKGRVSPVHELGLDVAVATSDAGAVRNILSQYLVHKGVASEVSADADAKDMDRRPRGTNEDSIVSGWIPAAQYEHLLADLRRLDAPAATPRAAAPASHGGRAEEADAGLVFVRIRLAASAK